MQELVGEWCSISTTFQPKAGLMVNKVTHKIISVLSLALVICMRIKLVVIYKASPMTPESDDYGRSWYSLSRLHLIPVPFPFPVIQKKKVHTTQIVSTKHGVDCPIKVAAHQGLPVI